MTAFSQLILFDNLGVRTAIVGDWRALSYERRLNHWGPVTVSIPTDDPKRPLFDQVDATLHVQRRDLEIGLDWYEEYGGFLRTQELATSERDLRLATFYGRSYEDLLRRRHNLYPNLPVSGPGESIIKLYVEANLGPSATVASGRYLDNPFPNFVVEADGATGTVWSGTTDVKLILETIQEIALITDVDFWIEQNDPTDPSLGYIFRAGRRGLDKTVGNLDGRPPVIFAVQRGDLATPNYTYSRTEEVTKVLVRGQVGSATNISPRSTDSPYNSGESYITEQRVGFTTTEYQTMADIEMARLAPRRALKFRALQQPGNAYRRDYDLGDSVTVFYEGVRVDLRIIAIRVNVSEGKESLEITTADNFLPIPSNYNEAVVLGLQNLAARIKALEGRTT